MTTDIKPIGVMGIQGRDGSTSSLLIAGNQCLEAYNVDWYKSGLGRKRGGSSNLSLATAGTAFSQGTAALGRFVPDFDQTLAELWAIDFALNFHRLAGSAVWASPTVMDACTATPQETVFLPFNGKLYIFYKNVHNRAHVWDPVTLTVRRVGMDLPGIPTVVIAGGAITDTRRYRVAWTKQVSGVTTYRSNIGTVTGNQVLVAQQATVSRGAAPGEGETHWELYGAATPGFGDYRLVGTATIATASIVDNAALPATVAPSAGENTPFPSAKFAVADDSRIVMAGAYETSANAENAATPSDRRVWWSSIPGAGTGDDERIEITGTINNYADLAEAVTGISEPLQVVSAQATSLERGSFYVFSYDSQWKFISTGVAATPYLKFRISGGGGCVHHKSIITAIDISGSPCIYWWSKDGPYRISTTGQEFLGQDILDVIETINLDATVPCHTVFHRGIHQVWFHVATGTSLYPDTRLVFDTLLGRVVEKVGIRLGWSVHKGEATSAYCSCLFSDTVGAIMGRKLKPYVGYTGANQVWKCDTTDTTDNTNKFQAYIDTKSYASWGLSSRGGMTEEAMVIANAQDGVTVQLTVYTSEGEESGVSTADLTDNSDAGLATQVFTVFENSRLADSFSFRCRIGDAQAIDNTWNLQGLIVPVTSHEG